MERARERVRAVRADERVRRPRRAGIMSEPSATTSADASGIRAKVR